jgi:Putative DNA-binding domain
MPALADLQADVRHALLAGETTALEPLLVGGQNGRKRLAIHQRHYTASLITSLLDRFPATVWLVGSEFVQRAAQHFVRLRPPTRPCIAEYGEEFPAYLMAQTSVVELPYLGQFAALEWHLGRLSLAVDLPSLSAADLSGFDPGALTDARIALQPGLQLVNTHWAIDQVMSLYLTDKAPDRFTLQAGDVWLELRGCRGELRMNRLPQVDFVFRSALAAGQLLGDAALSALEVDPAFDPGRALLNLLDERLVVTIDARRAEGVE